MPLNDIATEQTKATEKMQAATNQLLDYLATHPDATIRYHATNMILHIHSDASYLSVSNAQSRLGGLFFLGKQIPRARYAQRIHPHCRFHHQKRGRLQSGIISWSVLSQRPKWCPTQSYTHRAGPHTTPTPLRTDNSTAFGILNETIKQKLSKAMDMRYHWITYRVRQKQFDVYWRPGRENLGDYHTKHLSAQHHKAYV
jgi:hypothetical protein